MRVGLYARVSTEDQKTIPMQLEAMESYAEHRGWKVVAWVSEVASGGKQRPKREELLTLARRREVDGIVVWKLDRWGRSVADLVGSLKELQDLGVGFVSLTESLDFTTAAGRAMASLLAVFAEFERDLLRERVKAGLQQARKNGKRLGRPRTAMDQKYRVLRLARYELPKAEIARRIGIDRRSVYRILKQEKEENP